MNENAKEFTKEHYSFEDLVSIMAFLRAENGCPWDRAQDHRSIRKNLIEECYEAVEGIDKGDDALLTEELGDLLLQVVFHARIAEDEGSFDISDVIDGICRKMIRRHPHIFAGVRADNPEEAYDRWEEIKKKEKGDKPLGESLDSVAKTLPSLMRTQKLLKKAKKAGVLEASDLPRDRLVNELFSLCLEANENGVDLEEELFAANEAFIKNMERKAKNRSVKENGHEDR